MAQEFSRISDCTREHLLGVVWYISHCIRFTTRNPCAGRPTVWWLRIIDAYLFSEHCTVFQNVVTKLISITVSLHWLEAYTILTSNSNICNGKENCMYFRHKADFDGLQQRQNKLGVFHLLKLLMSHIICGLHFLLNYWMPFMSLCTPYLPHTVPGILLRQPDDSGIHQHI